MYSLINKLIVITGASSGIGKASAIQFGKESMKIALVGRNERRLEAVSENINRQNQSVSKIFPCDLREIEKIPALVKKIESSFGETVDILLNAAGVAVLGYVENIPLEEYYENFEINFFAALNLIQAIIPGMKEKKSGQIINITSGFGIRGLPGYSSYCATKFALNGLTESLRVELKPFGVHVISFSPGPVSTPFVKNQKIFGELKEIFNIENMRKPEDVAMKIVKASKCGARHIELSLRTRIARQLNHFLPSLFDAILENKMERLSRMALPSKVIDIHAFYDKSRMNIFEYLKLMDNYNIETVVLSPQSAYNEPKKSEMMYRIQRILLWNDFLRIFAKMISKTFYDSDGKLRRLWRLFTSENNSLNKVMEPNNGALEELIKVDKNRLKMWYWINPNNDISLTALKEKLFNPQIIGIKFHAYWHGFDLKILDQFMNICEQNNIPVYIILGFGKSGDYNHLIKNYPHNTIIFGYGGFPYFRKLWKTIKDKPKKYIDLTSIHLDKAIIGAALQMLGPRKCFYGSDCPYNFIDSSGSFNYNLTFYRLEFPFLSNDDLKDIFYKNFENNISNIS